MRFKCDVWRLLYNFLRLKECKMIDKYPGRVYIGIKPIYPTGVFLCKEKFSLCQRIRKKARRGSVRPYYGNGCGKSADPVPLCFRRGRQRVCSENRGCSPSADPVLPNTESDRPRTCKILCDRTGSGAGNFITGVFPRGAVCQHSGSGRRGSRLQTVFDLLCSAGCFEG